MHFQGPILYPFKTFLWHIFTSDDLRSHFEVIIGNLNQKLINCKRILYWNSKHTLPKNPTYTFIQTYTFINFQQKVPPICLFSPILLLIFKESSHLHFYLEPLSIRNSRVLHYSSYYKYWLEFFHHLQLNILVDLKI